VVTFARKLPRKAKMAGSNFMTLVERKNGGPHRFRRRPMMEAFSGSRADYFLRAEFETFCIAASLG